jgi:hypothetical protein
MITTDKSDDSVTGTKPMTATVICDRQQYFGKDIHLSVAGDSVENAT